MTIKHKEELTFILLKLFWKTTEEVTLSNQYYTASNLHTKTHKWKWKFHFGRHSVTSNSFFFFMSNSLWSHELYSPWNSPGQNTRVGSLSPLWGIIPTQGLNPGLLHCRWILYQLSHKGSPRILGCVAYPFSSRSSRPRNQTGVSCIVGGFFINWAINKDSTKKITPNITGEHPPKNTQQRSDKPNSTVL